MTIELHTKYDIVNKVVVNDKVVAYRISSNKPSIIKLFELEVNSSSTIDNDILGRKEDILVLELYDIDKHSVVCHDLKSIENHLIQEVIKNKDEWFGKNSPQSIVFEKMLKSCISQNKCVTFRHNSKELLNIEKGTVVKCTVKVNEIIVYPKICVVDFCITKSEILPNCYSDFFSYKEQEPLKNIQIIELPYTTELEIPNKEQLTKMPNTNIQEQEQEQLTRIPNTNIQEREQEREREQEQKQEQLTKMPNTDIQVVPESNPFKDITDDIIEKIEVPYESIKLRRRFETNTSAECKTNDKWQPVTILGHHLEDNVLLYKVLHTSGSVESNVSESCLRHTVNKKIDMKEITEKEIKEKIKEAIDKDDVETSLKWSKVLKNMKIN